MRHRYESPHEIFEFVEVARGILRGSLGAIRHLVPSPRRKDAVLCEKSQEVVIDAPSEGSENLMIEKVNLTNFRGFRELEVSELKKINLLVGPNSSGKSAFLESIFLASSSAAAATIFQLRGIRRMGNQVVQPSDAQTYRGLWGDLFFDFKDDKKISIKIGGQPNSDSRHLSIEYTSSQSRELPFGKQPPTSGANVEQTNALPQIE